MRALVTGSAGFLGSHFVAELQRRGWQTVCVDVASETPRRRWDALDFFRTHTGRFDLAVHCAAVVGGRETIDRRPLAQILNLALDAAYIDWCDRTRPGRAVYLSSAAAYPVRLQTPAAAHFRLAEDDINLHRADEPDAGYGWQKLTGERLAAQAEAAGVDMLVVRPFSGYGETQSLDYPFPSFAARARRRADPFEVWGDGTQVRDWIHAADVVGATLAAVEQGADGPVNLGWGEPVSMGELVMMFCEQAGYHPTVDLHTDAPTGVAWRVCDPARMLAFYAPKITLEEGVHRALTYDTVPA